MDLSTIQCVITGISGETARGVANHLLEKGATIIGTTRPKNVTQDLVRLSTHEYRVEMDPMNSESVLAAIDSIASSTGQIHVWINVVGGFDMGHNVEDYFTKSWEQMMRVNFSTVLNTTQAILPHFKKFQAGRLINFGSAAVETGLPTAAPYLVSKAAVHTLTQACASELSGDITCNALLPGTIDTSINRSVMPEADFSSWTSLQTIAENIETLIKGSQNGALIQL